MVITIITVFGSHNHVFYVIVMLFADADSNAQSIKSHDRNLFIKAVSWELKEDTSQWQIFRWRVAGEAGKHRRILPTSFISLIKRIFKLGVSSILAYFLVR